MTAPADPVLLVAHGSRDPRAVLATRALVRAVATACPDRPVRAGYLDHVAPTPDVVLQSWAAAGHKTAVMVPLLLTDAHHGRVDIPDVVRRARAAGLRMTVRTTSVLGPVLDDAPVVGDAPGQGTAPVDPRLVSALRRRVLASAPAGFDAVVLASAGTRNAVARLMVGRVADALGEVFGLPCVSAYASAAGPTPDVAVAGLRTAGARRVVVASYFLAPGRLYDRVVSTARDAGAIAVAEPLGAAREIVGLVTERIGFVAGVRDHSGVTTRDVATTTRIAEQVGRQFG